MSFAIMYPAMAHSSVVQAATITARENTVALAATAPALGSDASILAITSGTHDPAAALSQATVNSHVAAAHALCSAQPFDRQACYAASQAAGQMSAALQCGSGPAVPQPRGGILDYLFYPTWVASVNPTTSKVADLGISLAQVK